MADPATETASRKQRILTITLIVIGVIVVLFFGMRAVRSFRKMRPPGPPRLGHIETDTELIRGWMTVPYVADSYGIPEPELYKGLGLEPSKELGRKNLADLNQEYFPNQASYVINRIKEIIIEFQKTHPTPTP